jgi:hypothetical protein
MAGYARASGAFPQDPAGHPRAGGGKNPPE